MLITDPTKLTATDLKVQRAACWILGAYAIISERGFPRKLGTTYSARCEFHQHVNTALELVKEGTTARGPLVLYDLIDYVDRTAPRFHSPLWPNSETRS